MKLEGQSFSNSNTCHGRSFTSDGAPLDMAEIIISGRYPEQGWARNSQSHEMVQVSSGTGRLLFKDGETVELSMGEVAHVHPDTWFAWDGDMTILMACTPAFDAKQYQTSDDINYNEDQL